MLRYLCLLFCVYAFAKACPAQNVLTSEQQEVKGIITDFFEGFHKQDTTIMRRVVHESVMMQSIGKSSATSEITLSTQDFSAFLESICSLPSDMDFEERITDYEIRMDGEMANVWTPYSFYINGDLSHCGTNSFQLFKKEGVWKIFYIVDTRQKEDCGVRRG